MILPLSKQLYSEIVVRKALYWLKPDYQSGRDREHYLIKFNC